MSALDDLVREEREGKLDPEGAAMLREARRRGMVTQKPDAPVTVGGVAAAGGTGLAKGIIGATAALPGDLQELGNAAVTWLGTKLGASPERMKQITDDARVVPKQFPTTQQVAEKVGLTREPQNRAERWAESIGGGVGGMVAAPMSAPMSAARGFASLSPMVRQLIGRTKLGAFAGAGGEGGAEVAGATGMPEWVGRVLGSTGGSMWSLARHAETPQGVRFAKSLVQDEGPEGLQRMDEQRRAFAQRTGAPYLLTQGSDQERGITALGQYVLRHPEGGQSRAVLEQQQNLVQPQIGQVIRGVAPGHPPGQATEQAVSEAGRRALVDTPEQVTRTLERPLYNRARGDRIRGTEALRVADEIDNAIRNNRNLGVASPAGLELTRIAAALRREIPITQLPNGLTAVGRVPVLTLNTHSQALGKALQAIAERTPGAASIAPGAETGIAAAKDALDAALLAASPSLRRAKAVGGRSRDFFQETRNRTAMGEVFPNAGQQAGERAGGFAEFNAMMRDSGRDAADVSTVLRLTATENPDAARALVRGWLNDTDAKAAATSGGRLDAGRYFDSLAKNLAGAPGDTGRQQGAKLRAALESVGVANGVDGQTYAQSVRRFIEAVRGAARERGAVGQVASREAEEGARINWRSGAMKTMLSPQNIGYWGGRALERVVERDAVRALDRALTDPGPEGARRIIEIANWSNARERGKFALQYLVGLEAQAQARRDEE